jgi:hypothetical protein
MKNKLANEGKIQIEIFLIKRNTTVRCGVAGSQGRQKQEDHKLEASLGKDSEILSQKQNENKRVGDMA